jgi:hypothetical protein
VVGCCPINRPKKSSILLAGTILLGGKMSLKELGRVLYKFLRFVMTLGTAAYGGLTLWEAANADRPATIVFFFAASVLLFGMSYWWMFYSETIEKRGT